MPTMAARFHKMSIIGQLLRDPVVRTFSNGGRVAKFGLPVDFTRPKKNQETGQWEGESFIIDVDVFNRQNGAQLADLVEQYLKKGSLVYVEGRLKPNEFTDKNGVKVFKPVLVADQIQFLDPRSPDGGMGGDDHREARSEFRRPSAPARSAPSESSQDDMEPPSSAKDAQDDIPF
jgi:single-strand DNA-binding protein